MKKKLAISCILLSICFAGCEKPKRHPLSDVDVSIYLNINNAENTVLRVPGGSRIVSGGLNGVVVYRITESKFGAYELTCPYEEERNCILEQEGAVVTCPCCESAFSLLDGSKLSGPSNWPLMSYYISFDGVYIFVSN